ncbi:hypothetical protein DIPPA_06006 [Diplonema papillatum]|nr:hypothetical protein DIPPA_06006 [Diplonema papillatum]
MTEALKDDEPMMVSSGSDTEAERVAASAAKAKHATPVRRKRKRESALTTVCKNFEYMSVNNTPSTGSRGRCTVRAPSPCPNQTRSKSILKKTHSGSKVRFARAMFNDFVMFDEANIKEVQTCLHPNQGQAVPPDSQHAVFYGKRPVVLFQEAEATDSDNTNSQTMECVATHSSPPHGGFSDDEEADAHMEDGHDANARSAKRGPNFYVGVRQQEIEEGKRFRELLDSKNIYEDDEDGLFTIEAIPTSNQSTSSGPRPILTRARTAREYVGTSPSLQSSDSAADDFMACRLGSPPSPSPHGVVGEFCFGTSFDGIRGLNSPVMSRNEGNSQGGFKLEPPTTTKPPT